MLNVFRWRLNIHPSSKPEAEVSFRFRSSRFFFSLRNNKTRHQYFIQFLIFTHYFWHCADLPNKKTTNYSILNRILYESILQSIYNSFCWSLKIKIRIFFFCTSAKNGGFLKGPLVKFFIMQMMQQYHRDQEVKKKIIFRYWNVDEKSCLANFFRSADHI